MNAPADNHLSNIRRVLDLSIAEHDDGIEVDETTVALVLVALEYNGLLAVDPGPDPQAWIDEVREAARRALCTVMRDD